MPRDPAAAAGFLAAVKYTPLSFPREEYTYYSYDDYAVNTEAEWERWVEENHPDDPGTEVVVKMRNFDAMQKATYGLLADPSMSKYAFYMALGKKMTALPDVDGDSIFHILSLTEKNAVFELYEDKKRVHDTSKKTEAALGSRELAEKHAVAAAGRLQKAQADAAAAKDAYYTAAGIGAAAVCGITTATIFPPISLVSAGVVTASSIGGFIAVQESKAARVMGYGIYKLPVVLRGKPCEYMSKYDASQEILNEKASAKRKADADVAAASEALSSHKRQKLTARETDRMNNLVD